MIDCAVDKYAGDHNVPITYVSNFAAAYMHHHEYWAMSIINELYKTRKEYEVREIAKLMKTDITVCMEAICKIILSNAQLEDGRFLRAHGNTVFSVKDPSLPYVMVPDAEYDGEGARQHAIGKNIVMDGVDLWTFRRMPVKQKIEYLEGCIACGRIDLLSHVNTVYANIDGVICHLLAYRDLESSYSGTSPVPKRPLLKTRIFCDGAWKNVESTEDERYLLERYRTLVSELIDDADARYPIYGLISTIDGDMRLRLRNMENHEKSFGDSRYVRRGRSIKSIKKTILVEILSHLTGHDNGHVDSMTINEAVGRIDEALVNSGLYIVL